MSRLCSVSEALAQARILLYAKPRIHLPHLQGTDSQYQSSTATTTGQQTFAQSAVALLMNLGFDGIDIDYEYPASAAEATAFLQLLQTLRSALDTYAQTLSSPSTGTPHFLLSFAAPAGPTQMQLLAPVIKGMNKVLDFWNIMAYDYSGPWDTTTGHMSNLYRGINANITPFHTDYTMNYYAQHGATASNMNLGMPLYGQQFANTTGPGAPNSGSGTGGSWQTGVWDYKALPLNGSQVYYNPRVGASWSYDSATQTLISYDTPQAATEKANYIIYRELGGAMWWESSGDKKGNESLISTVCLLPHSPYPFRLHLFWVGGPSSSLLLYECLLTFWV